MLYSNLKLKRGAKFGIRELGFKSHCHHYLLSWQDQASQLYVNPWTNSPQGVWGSKGDREQNGFWQVCGASKPLWAVFIVVIVCVI